VFASAFCLSVLQFPRVLSLALPPYRCFLNALLQCLVGTPMLFNLILSQHSHSKLIEENRLAPDLYE
jgi:hypothetical protein